MRWWNLHSKRRLARLVGPPLAQGIRWCTSHTDGGWVQPGKLAMLVALDDGGAQVGWDGAGGAAEVQGLAGGAERGAEQGAAQLGGEPAGPGQQVEAPAQDGGLQPPPGGLQAAGYRAVPVARGGGGLAGAGAVAGAGARDVAGERDGAGARGVAGAGGWLVRVAAFRPSVRLVVPRPVRVVFPRPVRVVFLRPSGWSSRGPSAWSSGRPSAWSSRGPSGWSSGRPSGWSSRGPSAWSSAARRRGLPAGCRCGRGRGR